jgi:PAS domain S-box-containing protein
VEKVPHQIDVEKVLLQELMEGSPDYIFIKDRQSRFVVTNKSHATELLGLSDPQHAVGKTDFDLFPGKADDAQRFFAEEQMIMDTGEPVVRRQWMVPSTTTGKDVWLSESKLPITDEKSGEIIGIFGLGRDITERKKAELARERLTNQLQAAVDVTQAIMSILDPGELAERAVNIVRERFDLYYVGLFLVSQRTTLFEKAGEYAYLRAATGEAGKKLIGSGQKLRVDGNSTVGQCIVNGKYQLSTDAKSNAARFSSPILPDTTSEAVLPLIVRNDTIGAITIQSAGEKLLDNQDISVFQIVANQIAIVIENANLYQRINTELEHTQSELREQTKLGWDRYFGKKK